MWRARRLLRCGVWLGVAALVGCGAAPDEPPAANRSLSATAEPPGAAMDPEVVSAVKRRHDDLLMAIEGVVGTGISRDPAGTLAIEVYVDHLTDELSRLVPKTLEGVPVNLVETGSFTAR